MQTYRLTKGSALTYQEADDNLRFPHLWDATKTYKKDMVVFDGTNFYYLCKADVNTPSTIALTNTTYWKKLSQTVTLNLDDLGDVVITTPAVGQGIRFDGVNWVNDDGTLSVVNITFNQLTTLINTNKIVPGVYYRLEYQNIHTIEGTSTNYTGPIERLLLLGITTNKISKQAYSESFPNDTIQYDPTNILAEDGSTSRPGFIERRILNDNSISMPFDCRHTKVRRFKHAAANWGATTAYTKGQVVKNGNNLYGCFLAHTSTTSFTTDYPSYWCKLMDLNVNPWGEFIVPGSISSMPYSNLGGFSMPYNGSLFNDYDVLQNVFTTFNINVGDNLGNSQNNKFGDMLIGGGANGITIGSGCGGITIGGGAKETIIEGGSLYIYQDHDSSNIEISTSSAVIVAANANSNQVLSNSSRVTISESSSYNIMVGSILNSIGASSKYNKLENCNNVDLSTFTDSNKINTGGGVLLNTGCRNNELNSASAIILGASCLRNIIIDSTTITIASSCNFNEFYSTITAQLGSGSNSNKTTNVTTVVLGSGCNGNELIGNNGVQLGNNCIKNIVLDGTDGSNLRDGSANIYLRMSGGVIFPTSSNNCRFSNCSQVSFTDLAGGATDLIIEGSGIVTFGTACKEITIVNSSGHIVFGANNASIVATNSGFFTFGTGNTDFSISNSGNFTVGDSNSNGELTNSGNFTIGNASISPKISFSTYCSIGFGTLGITIRESSHATIGSNVAAALIVGADTVEIQSNCSNIEINASGNVTIRPGSTRVAVIMGCNILDVPPATLRTIYKGCTSVSYAGTPVITGCEFRTMTSCIVQANMSNVIVLAGISNKTFTQPYTNVVFSVYSNTTESLALAKTDRNYNSKSPNGMIWAPVSDDLGNITNESLS